MLENINNGGRVHRLECHYRIVCVRAEKRKAGTRVEWNLTFINTPSKPVGSVTLEYESDMMYTFFCRTDRLSYRKRDTVRCG